MSSLPSSKPAAAWTPRVFAPPGNQDPPVISSSGSLQFPGTPLRQHFEDYVVPHHLAEADRSTISEFRTTIRYWELATDDAPVEAFRTGLPLFLQWLTATPTRHGKLLSPATRRKHLGALQYLLDLAGPANRDRDAAGLIETPPRIRRPKGSASLVKRPLTLLEIGRLLATAQSTYWERAKLSLPACAFWRCLVLFLYNTGLRIETLMLLRREWLVQDDDEIWWLEIPPVAMKRDERFRCFVSPAAIRAIAPLLQLERPLIFGFPFGPNQARRKFNRLLTEAAIPAAGLHSNKFHALRRSCSVELQKVNVFAAKMQLGHSTRDVTFNHYSAASVLVQAHSLLPQPIWNGDFYGRQRRLFD